MKKTNFEGLLESIKEGGEILRGRIEPSRVFQVETPSSKTQIQQGFVMCVKTDDEKLLIPCKIYHARFTASGKVRIIDETGEAAVYPPDCFIRLDFSPEVENVLENLQKVA